MTGSNWSEERAAIVAALEAEISWYIVHTFRYQDRVATARRKAGLFRDFDRSS